MSKLASTNKIGNNNKKFECKWKTNPKDDQQRCISCKLKFRHFRRFQILLRKTQDWQQRITEQTVTWLRLRSIFLQIFRTNCGFSGEKSSGGPWSVQQNDVCSGRNEENTQRRKKTSSVNNHKSVWSFLINYSCNLIIDSYLPDYLSFLMIILWLWRWQTTPLRHSVLYLVTAVFFSENDQLLIWLPDLSKTGSPTLRRRKAR